MKVTGTIEEVRQLEDMLAAALLRVGEVKIIQQAVAATGGTERRVYQVVNNGLDLKFTHWEDHRTGEASLSMPNAARAVNELRKPECICRGNEWYPRCAVGSVYPNYISCWYKPHEYKRQCKYYSAKGKEVVECPSQAESPCAAPANTEVPSSPPLTTS